MSNCCTPANREATCDAVPVHGADPAHVTMGLTCPTCGSKGKAVDTQTVQAMLAVSLQTIRLTGYYFCRTPDCSVVYFSNDGQQIFVETDLREKVHQKHLYDDDVFVCYCFRHTPNTIGVELLESGASSVVETINAGIQAGQCACEIRNPQGSCCLGNVKAVLHQIIDAPLSRSRT